MLTNREIPTGLRYGWIKGQILTNSPQVASYRSRGSIVDFHRAHRKTSRQTEENVLKLWPVLREKTIKVRLKAFQFGVIKGQTPNLWPVWHVGEEFGLLCSKRF